jgi:hypothetical protein
MKAEEYNLDFTVTLTAEDAKFTDEAVAAGVPLIVVCMFRDALRKLVASEREACAALCFQIWNKWLDEKDTTPFPDAEDCATAIRARGQPEPWVKTYSGGKPNYTEPKEWFGLTDEEVMSLLPGAVRLPLGWVDTVRAIEAKLKEKNNG